MTRIKPVNEAHASPKTKSVLEGVRKSLGMVPNLVATMAHSPAALQAYLQFNQALGGSSLSPSVREQIALAVAGANSCQYCASAHTAMGKDAGVPENELALNLEGRSRDPRTQVLISFAQVIVRGRGHVVDAVLTSMRQAGFSEGEIVDVIATVAINIFTNYFNHIAGTQIDFPMVAVAEPMAA
jgi:uncharacterized peroxidase-related enzyme